MPAIYRRHCATVRVALYTFSPDYTQYSMVGYNYPCREVSNSIHPSLETTIATLTPNNDVKVGDWKDSVIIICDSDEEAHSFTLSSANCTIFPIVAGWNERYERNVTIPRTEPLYKISPLTTTFTRPPAPNGWKANEHPEGAIYFCHEDDRHENKKSITKVYTDAYLYDPQVLADITACINQIEHFICIKKLQLPRNAELVLDRQRRNDDTVIWGYYLVEHATRSLFWLEEFDATPILCEKTVTTPGHIRHEIESQYWTHWEMYPNALNLTHELVVELRGILLHATGDCLTSLVSTSPYGTKDLEKMLSLAKNMDIIASDTSLSADARNGTGHSACVFGRLMATFAHERFLNYHGQDGARLDRTKSVHGTKRERSVFGKVVSLVLFCAPDVHLQALDNLWVDESVNQEPWNDLMDKLYTEWQQYIPYAALLLNANISFLAVPGVGSGIASRSCAQIAIYGSATASITAMILGLLLLRQYRTRSRNTADQAFDILSTNNLETLAAVFSLPYALLMWGVVAFVFALVLKFFQSATPFALPSISGVTVLVVGMLLCWHCRTARGTQALKAVSASTTGLGSMLSICESSDGLTFDEKGNSPRGELPCEGWRRWLFRQPLQSDMIKV